MKRWLTPVVSSLVAATLAGAHCDTLDGPVIATARAALEKGEGTPVLKWVKKDAEAEIRAAFQKTLAVAAADKALGKGNADEVVKEVSEAAAAGIKQRFARVLEARKYAEHSVEAGRVHVEAYVEYMHYVKSIHADAGGGTAHHHHEE